MHSHTHARLSFILALSLAISLYFISSLTGRTPFALTGRPTSTTFFRSTLKLNAHLSELAKQFPGPLLVSSNFRTDDSESDGKFSYSAPASDQRANATLFILCKNSEVEGVVRSVRSVEDRFNKRYRYPYVLLSVDALTEEFKSKILSLTQAEVEFGTIPGEHWGQPKWIDEDRATKGRFGLVTKYIPHGGSVAYRNKARYHSGFFFKHPLLEKYRWYWRIEPDVHFPCDIRQDPFLFMQQNNKTVHFITLCTSGDGQYSMETCYWRCGDIYSALGCYASAATPLLRTVRPDFIKQCPKYIAQENALGFMSNNNGATWNLCHFGGGFEIADMDFWRSEAYTAFFDYLDSKGGIYYELWSEAAIHSTAIGLLVRRERIHFFDDIGYEQRSYLHCPTEAKSWSDGRCSCKRDRSFDHDRQSCLNLWKGLQP